MIDRKKIVETFHRIEKENGWADINNTGKIVDAVAAELNIPASDVRNVILAHWGIMGPV